MVHPCCVCLKSEAGGGDWTLMGDEKETWKVKTLDEILLEKKRRRALEGKTDNKRQKNVSKSEKQKCKNYVEQQIGLKNMDWIFILVSVPHFLKLYNFLTVLGAIFFYYNSKICDSAKVV